jgi:hypothetical protein
MLLINLLLKNWGKCFFIIEREKELNSLQINLEKGKSNQK